MIKMQPMTKQRFRGKMRESFYIIIDSMMLLVCILLISLARTIFDPSAPVDYFPQIFVPLMLCIYAPLMFFLRKQNYLECDEHGVLYSTINYQIYSPWSNIGTIARVDSRLFIGERTEALMLKEKAISGTIKEGQAQGRTVIERRFIGRYHIRPKLETAFSVWVIPTELVADEDGPFVFFIHTYAPHLLVTKMQA